MDRADLADLYAFSLVAAEGSFTRAAGKAGTSQSALSRTIRDLEARLGIRLLHRTTRKVAPTDAGARLLETLAPALDRIETELSALRGLRETPSGTLRITASRHAAQTLLWPVLRDFLPRYPEVKVELALDQRFTDIVAERYDAGVRLGEAIGRDMVAVRIGPDLRMCVVGSPAYFGEHGVPKTPRDLAGHRCINLRFRRTGALYAWELQKGSRAVNVRVEGSLVFDDSDMVLSAARDGFGLACVMNDGVKDDVEAGRLRVVMADWCPPFAGYHLYYPSRRQPSAAFRLLVEALRYPRPRARR